MSRGYAADVSEAPPGDSGQHECARGPWCASPRLIPATGGGFTRAAGLTWRAFCDPDRDRIAAALGDHATAGDLPAAWERLAAELGEPARTADPVRVPFGPTVPLRGDVDALMRETAVILCGWEARVRAVARLTPRDPSLPLVCLASVTRAAATCGIHTDALLALPPGWMTRVIPLRPGRHGREAGIGEDTLAAYGECDVVRVGVDSVTVILPLSGADAGNEILDLAARARRILGELRPRPEILDGVPCRSCGDMALERAEPPSDPSRPAMHSRCASCSALMELEEYRAWAAWYARWAESGGPPACRRCLRERHSECAWDACGCKAAGHQVAGVA